MTFGRPAAHDRRIYVQEFLPAPDRGAGRGYRAEQKQGFQIVRFGDFKLEVTAPLNFYSLILKTKGIYFISVLLPPWKSSRLGLQWVRFGSVQVKSS